MAPANASGLDRYEAEVAWWVKPDSAGLVLTSGKGVRLIIPRRSRRDIVLASSVRPSVCPSVHSVRPSVRNHISVPIGQI